MRNLVYHQLNEKKYTGGLWNVMLYENAQDIMDRESDKWRGTKQDKIKTTAVLKYPI